MSKKGKFVLLFFGVVLLVIFLWRSIIEFTSSSTEHLFTTYIEDSGIYPSDWYFSYINHLELDVILIRREDLEHSFLLTLISYEEISEGDAKTRAQNLIELFLKKGGSLEYLSKRNCLHLRGLLISSNFNTLEYFLDKLEAYDKSRTSYCVSALTETLINYEDRFTLSEKERINNLFSKLRG